VSPTGRRKGTLGTCVQWGSTVTPRQTHKIAKFLEKHFSVQKHSTDVNTSRLEYQLIVS
jgi:hypothetical protein